MVSDVYRITEQSTAPAAGGFEWLAQASDPPFTAAEDCDFVCEVGRGFSGSVWLVKLPT